MKRIVRSTFALIGAGALVSSAWARGVQAVGDAAGARPEQAVLPDKFFELGVPLLVVFLVLDAIVSLLKHRGEVQLKKTAVEKGISEDVLAKLFAASDRLARLQPLKWTFLALSVGLSLVLIGLIRPFMGAGSGYLAVGIVLVFAAGGFFAYYRVLESRAGGEIAEKK